MEPTKRKRSVCLEGNCKMFFITLHIYKAHSQSLLVLKHSFWPEDPFQLVIRAREFEERILLKSHFPQSPSDLVPDNYIRPEK